MEDIMKEMRAIDMKGVGMYFTRESEYPWAILNSNMERGMTCLDIGCDRSPFSIYLHRKGMNTVAIDMIDFSEYYSGSGVDFKCVNSDQISLPNEHFDRIFSISVFEHLNFETYKKTISEVVRLLRGGGLFIVTMDVRNSCKKHGFFGGYLTELFSRKELELIEFSPVYRAPFQPFRTDRVVQIVGMVFIKKTKEEENVGSI